MAYLRKALVAAMPGGRLPNGQEELEAAVADLWDLLAGRKATVMSRAALYRHLVNLSEAGFSGRALDKLLQRAGVTGLGDLKREDFAKFLSCAVVIMKEDLRFEESSKGAIPDNYVVRGSSRMNQVSGTNAFSMQVIRRASMKRLWQLFRDLDSDGDGMLSLAEFKKYISRNRPELSKMATSIFYSLDKRKEGLLSFRGILQRLFPNATVDDVHQLMRMACPKDFTPHTRPDERLVEEVRSVFAVFDDDRSGSLDADEFVHAMGLLGFSRQESEAMMLAIDKEGDGEIQFDEFEAWYIENHESLRTRMNSADGPDE